MKSAQYRYSVPAPTLLTDRLWLDGHRVEDLEPLAAIWQQPEVYTFIGDGHPRSREDVWLRLLRSVGQWALLGYGGWVVRDRADGAVLGDIGLLEAKRAIQPRLDAPELSWMLGREAQGLGYAREALAAILGWADANGHPRTLCIVDPANLKSIRLAEHLGYRFAGTGDYAARTVNLYRRVP